MKKKKLLMGFLVLTLAAALSAGAAFAETITATVSCNGGPCQGGYLYLHRCTVQNSTSLGGACLPGGDKGTSVTEPFAFISMPLKYGPSNSSGVITAYNVPSGYYAWTFIKRGAADAGQIYGPPQPEDYFAFSDEAMYVGSTFVTTKSGTVYGTYNMSAAANVDEKNDPSADAGLPGNYYTITGRVTGASTGKPLAGWAVKVTTVACNGNLCGASWRNYCGTSKGDKVYPAWTDSNGYYTVGVDPNADGSVSGTYYVYAGPAFKSGRGSLWYTSCGAKAACTGSLNTYPSCPVGVSATTIATANIVVPGH